jgi:hypothetical protein
MRLRLGVITINELEEIVKSLRLGSLAGAG